MRSLEKLMEWRGKKVHFQTTLEDFRSLRHPGNELHIVSPGILTSSPYALRHPGDYSLRHQEELQVDVDVVQVDAAFRYWVILLMHVRICVYNRK